MMIAVPTGEPDMTAPTILTTLQPRPTWHDRASVTKREAAAILDRSIEWVELQVAAAELYSFQTRRGGPHLICVQSILDMINEGRHAGRLRPASSVRSRAPLQLVWINPAM